LGQNKKKEGKISGPKRGIKLSKRRFKNISIQPCSTACFLRKKARGSMRKKRWGKKKSAEGCKAENCGVLIGMIFAQGGWELGSLASFNQKKTKPVFDTGNWEAKFYQKDSYDY